MTWIKLKAEGWRWIDWRRVSRVHTIGFGRVDESTTTPERPKRAGLDGDPKRVFVWILFTAETPQYHLPELPWLNMLRCPSELNGARRGRQRTLSLIPFCFPYNSIRRYICFEWPCYGFYVIYFFSANFAPWAKFTPLNAFVFLFNYGGRWKNTPTYLYSKARTISIAEGLIRD